MVIIDPHKSVVFSGKLLGLIEKLWPELKISSEDYDRNFFPYTQWIKRNNLTFKKLESTDLINKECILIEPRQLFQNINILEHASKIIISSNHFMVANNQVVEFLNIYKGKISIILENYSSLVHISEMFGPKILFDKIFLIPPLIESKYEKNLLPVISLLIKLPVNITQGGI